MKTNDILRRLRYAFNFSDADMIAVFGLSGHVVTRSEVSDWLKKESDPAFREMTDAECSVFLDGLIVRLRGPFDGEPRKPETKLNNNLILRKLKIALSYRDDDIQDILAMMGMSVSKHEISAFFRSPGQSQYRECKDQFLRKFLSGVQYKLRGAMAPEDE
jgi:uncharacterized protein YehS (DUF1456 family)